MSGRGLSAPLRLCANSIFLYAQSDQPAKLRYCCGCGKSGTAAALPGLLIYVGSHCEHAPAVLIVDDEPLIRMAAADTLADAGVTPFEAANGGEALEMLEEHPEIALVVTDVEMPGMDGVTLARRACDLRPELGIIVTSARGEAFAPDLPGGGAFLAKPYGTRQLMALIRDKLSLEH